MLATASAQTPSLARFSHGVDLTRPPDTLGQLDDWRLFEPGDQIGLLFSHVSAFVVVFLIGTGVLARTRKAVSPFQADGLRRVCFTWLLPAFLLRHIWLCQLDSGLYAVAVWSFVFHGLWLGASVVVSPILEPHDRQIRGWAMLMSVGAMNSFLYPLLLRHPGFGERSLACAVLWDLGGNMWVCQFALFGIAARFSGKGAVDEQVNRPEYGMDGLSNEEEEGEALLPSSYNLDVTREKRQWSGVQGATVDGDTLRYFPCMPRSVLMKALRQPVLICCVTGFLLNTAGVPLVASLDILLWSLGEPYKLVLYFLMGFYGDHTLSLGDASLMARVLGLRYALSFGIVALTLLLLPIELMFRQTVALALLSPTSSYLIYLVAEHGYGKDLLRLTVCTGFVSVLMSTLAQTSLIEVFDAAAQGDALGSASVGPVY